MDKCMFVCFLHSNVCSVLYYSWQMPIFICKNTAPNLQETFYQDLQQTFLYYWQLFHILTHQPRGSASIFLYHRFSCRAKLLYLVSTSGVWPFGCNSVMMTTSDQTSLRSGLVFFGPTGFCQSKLMALLDFWLWEKISMMCLSSAAVSFLGWLLCLQSSVMLVSLCLFKTTWTAHCNSSQLWNVCLKETLLMWYNYLVYCCCAQSCPGVWPVSWNSLTLVAVWLFSI